MFIVFDDRSSDSPFVERVWRCHSERAILLRNGALIADTVHDCGFYDQAHLTRSLRRLIGLTPATIARSERQLSFLYNTTPVP